jgi:hypothetical protein
VRCEDDVGVRSAHLVCEDVQERVVVVPAVDETELGTTVERRLELLAVPLDREGRIVRRKHESDDAVRLGGAGCGLGDVRRPVLHPELAFERGAGRLGDLVERVRVLDTEPPVALDEVGELLGRDRPAAANVGVVGGYVGEALR